MRNRRGMTLLEVSISTTVLSVLVFAAATVARVAMVATGAVVSDDAADGKERRTEDRLDELLLSASVATLQGIPATQGQVAETMLDGVDYRDLRFRRVVGFLNGALTYEPPLGTSALRLYRAVDRVGAGSLVLEDGGATTTLLADVSSVTFRRSGTKLTATVVHGHGDLETDVHDLVLRVP